MNNYKIKDPNTGFSLTLKSNRPPTQEEAMQLFQQQRSKTTEELSKPIPMLPRGGVRDKAQKQNPIEYYNKKVPMALGIQKDQFDAETGASNRVRKNLSFLSNLSLQKQYLEKEFGQENVKALNIAGDQTLLLKEDNKWKFVDGKSKAEMADFTGDLAGEIAPTVAGIGAAIATAGASPIAQAAAYNLAYSSVGAAQDVLAQSQLGVDVDLSDIATERAKEFAIGGAIDLATMATGRLVAGLFVAKESKDLVVTQLKKVATEEGVEIPAFMLQGDKKIKRVADVASKYPDSTAGRLFEDMRDLAAGKIEGRIVDPEPMARRMFSNLKDQIENDLNVTKGNITSIEGKVSVIKGKRETLNKKAEKIAEAKFAKEWKDLTFRLENKNALSPLQIGKKIQKKAADRYATLEATRTKLYDKAYALIGESGVSTDLVLDAFDESTSSAILNAKEDVISILNTSGETVAGRAVKGLTDSKSDTVSFRKLNEVIANLNEKIKYGKTAGGQTASLKPVVEQVQRIRDGLLKSTPKEAQDAFAQAQEFFATEIPKIRDSRTFNFIMPDIGQSYDGLIAAKLAGKAGRAPDFYADPGEMLKSALKNTKHLNDFMDAVGNDREILLDLRRAWLQDKGFKPNSMASIEKIKSLNPSDYDMAKALWPKSMGNGINRKVFQLKNIANVAAGKDGKVKGMTAEIFEDLVADSTEIKEKEIKELLKKQGEAELEYDELVSNKLVKLFADGSVPLPDNQITFNSMMKGMLQSKNADIVKMMDRVNKFNPELSNKIKDAAVLNLIESSGRGTDIAEVGKLGKQLWNAKSFGASLESNKDKYITLLGKDEYKFLKKWNDVMGRFGDTKTEEARLKVAGAIGPSAESAVKLRGYLNNFTDPVVDRLRSAMITTVLKFPSLQKKVLSVDSYDKLMDVVMRVTFMSSEGMQSLTNQADADPEFRQWLTEQYADMLATQ